MNALIRALSASLLLTQSVFALAESPSVEILSAVVKDQRIAGADVLIQRNGEHSALANTDAQGRAVLPGTYPDDGNSLLIIRKPGYSNLVVRCPCRGMTYAISPVMQNLDGIRVVLSWGEIPQDLDSHLSFPGNHVYFDHKVGADTNLDVDDVNSYGPETITLSKKHFGESYVYSVHDYSNSQRPSSMGLSNSHAKVFVYVGQSLVRTYYVPRNQAGNLWTVFRLTKNGEFEDINRLSGTQMQAGQIDEQTASYLSDASVEAAPVSVAAMDEAKRLNRQGEEAYHAGELDDAIELYRQSIDADAVYGQAYSNLGLAYQKVGRTAESIWANRKAIALASGPSAATVRASSYYNIGRIYEAAGQRTDALRNYQLAKSQKANSVYDKAIRRVGG
ncbi:hypothetical protein ACOXVJ_10505 [Pseudomonas knackmussii]|uniref:YfaP family protein n=1 Tax=Pseudomonas knackmussii TaxID=65741 RepID=UPI003BDED26F